MNTRQIFIALAFLGRSGFAAPGGDELSRAWSDPSVSLRDRAEAVNRAFTNGTPVSVVVAVLGTNYMVCGSSARVWMGAEHEPPNTLWLRYRFGEGEVTIGTSAVWGRDLDPLSSKFTGAGNSLAMRSSTTTNRIWIGQGTRSVPVWAKEQPISKKERSEIEAVIKKQTDEKILSIRRESEDSVEVKTGVITPGRLDGKGQTFWLKRTKNGWEVEKKGMWVS